MKTAPHSGLDGLEITLAGAVAGVLTQSDTLHLSSAAVGAVATVYLVGEVAGALVFGRLADKLGRRKLFAVTLGVYLIGSGLTAATAGAGPGWVGPRGRAHRRPRKRQGPASAGQGPEARPGLCRPGTEGLEIGDGDETVKQPMETVKQAMENIE